MFNGRQSPGGINGSNPLIYQGSTPNMVTINRRPTVQDGFSWPIGMWWIIPIDTTFATGEVWTLVSKSEGINTWKKLRGGGGPTPPGNIVSINKIFLTTPGAGTYTPTTGMSECYVECVGAGGGGAGYANAGANNRFMAGGAGGGYCAKLFTASQIGASQSYVVGAGGSGGAAPAPGSGTVVAGSAGVSTTFGSFLTASGGSGANTSLSGVVSGGSGTGGSINISGGSNGVAVLLGNAGSFEQSATGVGGNSMYGIGGGAITTDSGGGLGSSVIGLSGTGYGSGCGGSLAAFAPSVVAGQSGQGGIIIITEYIG